MKPKGYVAHMSKVYAAIRSLEGKELSLNVCLDAIANFELNSFEGLLAVCKLRDKTTDATIINFSHKVGKMPVLDGIDYLETCMRNRS